MRWLGRLIGRERSPALRLVRLRTTRFRQLLRRYGRFLDLETDAADKQAGDYVLDRGYVATLVETVFDLAEAVVFDLNVLTAGRHEAAHGVVESLRKEVRRLVVASRPEPGAAPLALETAAVPPDTLAAALERTRVLHRGSGEVACRGVAAGPVFRAEAAPEVVACPPGSVLVGDALPPEERLLEAARHAVAILVEGSRLASDAGRLVREFRLPTLVGLRDAAARLTPGTVVTVDADENVVYEGRVHELLEYYRLHRLGQGEEPEYVALRQVRRAMFPLSSGDCPARLEDCTAVRELVYLAQELAGEALIDQLGERRELWANACAGPSGTRVLDLGEGLSRDEADAEDVALRSRPLRALLRGLNLSDSTAAAPLPDSVLAVVTEEHATVLLRGLAGCELIDSFVGASRDSNYLYCQFAPGGDLTEPPRLRGRFAGEVLTGLDFAVTHTPGALSGWLGGLPQAETEERLEIVAHLASALHAVDATGWHGFSPAEQVPRFMAQYT